MRREQLRPSAGPRPWGRGRRRRPGGATPWRRPCRAAAEARRCKRPLSLRTLLSLATCAAPCPGSRPAGPGTAAAAGTAPRAGCRPARRQTTGGRAAAAGPTCWTAAGRRRRQRAEARARAQRAGSQARRRAGRPARRLRHSPAFCGPAVAFLLSGSHRRRLRMQRWGAQRPAAMTAQKRRSLHNRSMAQSRHSQSGCFILMSFTHKELSRVLTLPQRVHCFCKRVTSKWPSIIGRHWQ